MSADVIQIRDYQSKKDLARMQAELERQAMEIANIAFPSVFGTATAEMVPYHAAGIDGMFDGKDPA